jgi:hypothetical protein
MNEEVQAPETIDDFAALLQGASEHDQPQEEESQNEEAEAVATDDEAPGKDPEQDGQGEEPPALDVIEYEVDGEKKQASRDDAVKALRDAELMRKDYTQKTQRIAEEAKAKQEEAEKRFQFVHANAEKLGDLQSAVAQIRQYEQIDWNALRASDPQAYTSYRLEFNEAKSRAQELSTEISQMRHSWEQEQGKARQAKYSNVLQSLEKNISGFKVETLAETFKDIATKYGAGFEALNTIEDAGLAHALYDLRLKAAAYDALTANKAEVTNKVAKLPPKTKQAVAPTSTRTQEVIAKALRGGSVDDFAAALTASRKK